MAAPDRRKIPFESKQPHKFYTRTSFGTKRKELWNIAGLKYTFGPKILVTALTWANDICCNQYVTLVNDICCNQYVTLVNDICCNQYVTLVNDICCNQYVTLVNDIFCNQYVTLVNDIFCNQYVTLGQRYLL